MKCELQLCESEFRDLCNSLHRFAFNCLHLSQSLSLFVSSGVWAEERDPQAAGVQESRDQVFLQWVKFDLFFPSSPEQKLHFKVVCISRKMCLYSGLHFIFSSVQINYFLLHQQNTHSVWIIFGILILDQLVNVCHGKTKSVQAPRAFLWYVDCWSSRVRSVRVFAWTVRNCKGHFWQFLINSVAVSSRSPNFVRSLFTFLCNRCQGVRAGEANAWRRAEEKDHAVWRAAVHPGWQSLSAVAQQTGCNVRL